MALHITMIQGGGIGFDQAAAVRRVLAAAGEDIVWDEHLAGGAAAAQGSDPLPERMVEAARSSGLVLKTKLLPSPEEPHRNYNIALRRRLGVFASVRPLRNIPGIPARFQGVDMLVIRELTEDLYAAIEHQIVPGVVQSIKVVTLDTCRRFFRFALERVRQMGRKTVHCVHKANILKLADGLFLEAFRETAREFPELTPKEIIVDNCCMQMVSRPQQFDVLVMGNLYGDIVSDLGAGVVGGISATSAINVGEGLQVFETVHGGPIDRVGADRANPLPLLLPAMDLLEAVGRQETAARIRKGVEAVVGRGIRTADVGGTARTSEMAQAIAEEVEK